MPSVLTSAEIAHYQQQGDVIPACQIEPTVLARTQEALDCCPR